MTFAFFGIRLFPGDTSVQGQRLPVVLRPRLLRTNLSHHISGVNHHFQTVINGSSIIFITQAGMQHAMTNFVESFNATSSVFAARLDGFYPSRIEWWARVSILPLPQAFMDGMHGRQSSLSCETRVLDTLLCAQSLLALHVGSCPYGSPSHTVTCHLTADENKCFSLDSKLLR